MVACTNAEILRDVIPVRIFADVTTPLDIANHLTARGVKAARGNVFAPTVAKRTIERLGIAFPQASQSDDKD